MARLKLGSREARVRKVQKKLEALDYIPRAAKYVAEILVVLAESSPRARQDVLDAFGKAANEKPTWEVAGRRV